MIDGPRWFDVLPTSGTVAVTGTVAAERADSYDYRVEWAPGQQGPAHPGTDTWTTIATETGLTAARSGTLATLDLAQVAAALPGGGTGAPVGPDGRPDPERFAVRLRVTVTAHGGDGDGLVGEMQKQVVVHDDPDLVDGYPARVDDVGAPSPSFTDVDGDGTTELVVGTDAGEVHAWAADGDEAAGFPLRTDEAPWWPTGSPTAAEDGIDALHSAVTLGGPALGDLDGDDDLDVVVADTDGRITVWDEGVRTAEMAVDPAFSRDDRARQDSRNRTKPGFLAAPALGDLDGDGDLEIVAAAMDRHVYAWHHDGTAVDGFPVLVVDPAKVSAVDPTSHRVTFASGSGVGEGGELTATPALADLDGDGRPEIVIGGQEQYVETPNLGDGEVVQLLLSAAGSAGNSRVYAISPDGAAADASPTSAVHPHAQAYLPGWPAELAMAATGLLPTIGGGVSMPAAVSDLHPSPGPEVVVSSAAGPVYVLDAEGDSVYGTGANGGDLPLYWSAGLGATGSFGADRTSDDLAASLAAFGGPAVADLDGDGAADVTAPTAGLSRLIDLLAPDLQLPNDDQLSLWSGRSRLPFAGSPQATPDMAFFVAPAVADLDGDGRPESIAGNGVNTVSAYDHTGAAPDGWPKVTGGWTVGTPAVGDWDGDGSLEVAQPRRDGVLFVWTTAAGTATDGAAPWSQWGCDAAHTGACVEAEATLDGDAAYVDAVYRLVLGRSAEPAGLDYWVGRLQGGLSRGRFALTLLALPEPRRRLCAQAYRSILDRSAEPAALGWCAGTIAGGWDLTDVRVVLAASAEMWAAGGSTAGGFVDLLYQRGLGRAPGAGERSYWTGRLAAGSRRGTVARGILDSAEGQGRLVDELYRTVLERSVEPAGRAYWVGRLRAGVRDVTLYAQLVGSPEYYARVTR